MTPEQSAAILSQARHRGARNWRYDADRQRVEPAAWGALEVLPSLTGWEACTLARRLVEIGAVRIDESLSVE